MSRTSGGDLYIEGKLVSCVYRTGNEDTPVCRAVGRDTKGVIPHNVRYLCRSGEPWQNADEFLKKWGLKRGEKVAQAKKSVSRKAKHAIVGKW